MRRDALLHRWDVVYEQLCELQDEVLRLRGDRVGAEMYRLLGLVRAEAERSAPGGWSVVDVGRLPVEVSDG